jgi:hypothetical protein
LTGASAHLADGAGSARTNDGDSHWVCRDVEDQLRPGASPACEDALNRPPGGVRREIRLSTILSEHTADPSVLPEARLALVRGYHETEIQNYFALVSTATPREHWLVTSFKDKILRNFREVMMEVLNQAIGQLIALFAFFAFPVIQYMLLKAFSRKEGSPELWYLPDHGFRLVIRNLPRKRILTDIRYRVSVRQMQPSSKGSSVASIMEKRLLTREDMALFPGIDQILLEFKLYQGDDGIKEGNVILAPSSGYADEGQSAIDIGISDRVVCNYSATIQNFFNFNVQLGKRVEITGFDLFELLVEIVAVNAEQSFPLKYVRNFQ